MAGSPNFEVPKQLRELTEKNLEQVRAGYGQFMEFHDSRRLSRCTARVRGPSSRNEGVHKGPPKVGRVSRTPLPGMRSEITTVTPH